MFAVHPTHMTDAFIPPGSLHVIVVGRLVTSAKDACDVATSTITRQQATATATSSITLGNVITQS